ncbi:hypothetical protein H6F90_21445 [Trichocoleus sp. FACHB-591]|uniref:hypothetical protein n=1 Tax=Trichocoleus sp. FACHB-591 TaxID=2692872 RepID=UPI0016841D16|nr:hypothetical protein [Trichocoleus sp. FACHB-591]MBD2097667.1 hypothetical protein [Trichocoleus sp. FACHB-591]
MQKPASVKSLENLGRVRLSQNFFMRDFLYSEVANFYGISNIPEDPDLAIAANKHLCEELLEPLQTTFGRITIRSGYRALEVDRIRNEKNLGCSDNEANQAGHLWDQHLEISHPQRQHRLKCHAPVLHQRTQRSFGNFAKSFSSLSGSNWYLTIDLVQV